MTNERPADKGTIWTYAYQIEPPQSETLLRSIRQVLDAEHARAERKARTWAGRLVTEERVTHILVVSDSPEQGRRINRRLEAGLRKLGVAFSVTFPLAVVPDAPGSPPGEADLE